MKKTEIVKLFALIRSEYANFESTEEKRMLWDELMSDLSFEKAVANVKEYMKRISDFPPRAADIIREDPEVFTDYDQLREDTQNYLEQREERQRLAIDCPPQFRVRQLSDGGDADD